MGLFSKVVYCQTHKRFNKLFRKLEDEGYYLYVSGKYNTDEARVRRFIKNLGKAVALYDKFTK